MHETAMFTARLTRYYDAAEPYDTGVGTFGTLEAAKDAVRERVSPTYPNAPFFEATITAPGHPTVRGIVDTKRGYDRAKWRWSQDAP